MRLRKIEFLINLINFNGSFVSSVLYIDLTFFAINFNGALKFKSNINKAYVQEEMTASACWDLIKSKRMLTSRFSHIKIKLVMKKLPSIHELENCR